MKLRVKVEYGTVLRVKVEYGTVSGAISARVPQLGLVSHGATKDEAAASLVEIVAIWCESLQINGYLDSPEDWQPDQARSDKP